MFVLSVSLCKLDTWSIYTRSALIAYALLLIEFLVHLKKKEFVVGQLLESLILPNQIRSEKIKIVLCGNNHGKSYG